MPPCTAIPEPQLRLDGQATDNGARRCGSCWTSRPGKTYEVMILTGDVFWNHDKEQFTAFDTGL